MARHPPTATAQDAFAVASITSCNHDVCWGECTDTATLTLRGWQSTLILWDAHGATLHRWSSDSRDNTSNDGEAGGSSGPDVNGYRLQVLGHLPLAALARAARAARNEFRAGARGPAQQDDEARREVSDSEVQWRRWR